MLKVLKSFYSNKICCPLTTQQQVNISPSRLNLNVNKNLVKYHKIPFLFLSFAKFCYDLHYKGDHGLRLEMK